jgi:hypothetical protein
MSTIKFKLKEEVLSLKQLEDQDMEYNQQYSKTAAATSEQQQLCASSKLPTYNHRQSTFVFGVNICHSNQSKSQSSKCRSMNKCHHHHSLVTTMANDDDDTNSNAAGADATNNVVTSTRPTSARSTSRSTSTSSVYQQYQTETIFSTAEVAAATSSSIRLNTAEAESTIVEC